MIKSDIILTFIEFSNCCNKIRDGIIDHELLKIYEVLCVKLSKLSKLCSSDDINKAKKLWLDVSVYISNNFFANDSIIDEYLKVKRNLRIYGFLDSKSNIK